ncbi:hypothetical protein ACLD02_16440 [Alloalcanivorax sp. C16-2]|uniref:hypothetical protein n=1 Tax=Alloalcanivorax sp. C16-2 TaxID=3390052 RepID=UPI003970849B
MTGPADGIWDDGEWISWDWINGQLADQEMQAEYPEASLDVIRVFEDLVEAAREYRDVTGRYLQIWGELGELYGEIKYGIERHAPGTKGSDGRLGNDWVEIKTISPEKGNRTVQVKRAGNFNKLLVVKITQDFEFESKLIDRKTLGKGKGKQAKVTWNSVEE